MSYTFSVTADNLHDLYTAISAEAVRVAMVMGGGVKTGAAVTAAQAAEMNPPATPLETAISEAGKTAAELGVPAAKEHKKRGPKPKVKPAPALGGHTVENAGGDENFPIIKTAIAEQPAAPTPATKDDARAALKALTGAKNMQAGIDLLKTFGAENLSTLDPAKYGEFIAACNAGVA